MTVARALLFITTTIVILQALVFALFSFTTLAGTSIYVGAELFPRSILIAITTLSFTILTASIVGCIGAFKKDTNYVLLHVFLLIGNALSQCYIGVRSWQTISNSNSDANNVFTRFPVSWIQSTFQCCDDGCKNAPSCVSVLDTFLQKQASDISITLWAASAFELIGVMGALFYIIHSRNEIIKSNIFKAIHKSI